MPWSRGNSSTASIITDPTQSKVVRGKKNSVHQSRTPSISIYWPRVLYSPLHPIKTLRHFLLIASSIIHCYVLFHGSPVTNLKPRTEKEWQSMHRKHKNIIQKQKERSAHQKLTTFRVPYRPRGNTICLRIMLWSWASSIGSSRHRYWSANRQLICEQNDWSPGIKNLDWNLFPRPIPAQIAWFKCEYQSSGLNN